VGPARIPVARASGRRTVGSFGHGTARPFGRHRREAVTQAATETNRDPFATVVETPAPTRGPAWWTFAWATLAGRVYTLIVLAVLTLIAFALVYERREADLARALQLTRAETWVRQIVVGDAVAATDLDALRSRFADLGLPADSSLAVVDGDGVVLLDVPGGAREGGRLDGLGAASGPLTGVGQPVEAGDGAPVGPRVGWITGLDGRRRVVGVNPIAIGDGRGALVLSAPADALLPPRSLGLARAAVVLAIVLVALFAGASLALSRLVFRPIRVLELAMLRVADGDLTSRVAPAARRGELRSLAGAFDGMTRALRHQRRALTIASDALADRERELRLLTDNIVDLVNATDADGRITYASPSHRDALGYDPATLLGRDASELLEPDDAARLEAQLDAGFRRGERRVRIEVRLRGASGNLDWFEMLVKPRLDDDGRFVGAQSTLREINERKHLETLLAEQALHDPLTGLPNRRFFAEVVARLLLHAKRSGETVAIGFVDLDGFKEVNDTYGHQAGDALLQEVADRLRSAVREGDVVARLGGDEFTVALRSLQDESHARAIAERMAAAFAVPFDLGVTTVASRASIGVALYPVHGTDLEALLRSSDRAMYRAKHDEPGSVAFASAPD
jgi:diguanylate cyclase (GGDEF)-like protein/PAS domain S-box-containing protein